VREQRDRGRAEQEQAGILPHGSPVSCCSCPPSQPTSRICHDSTLAGARRAAHVFDPAARRGQAAFPRRCDRIAQFAAADSRRPAREGRSGQLLDLHLHQLAPPASLCPRLGREILRPRADRGRGSHPRIRVRAQYRQRPPRCARHAGRLPGRDRQRLCGMERLRQPLLASPVLRRRAGPHSAPPLR